MKKKFTFLIAALFALMTSPGWGQSTYTKVTSTSDLTDGQYLIVYETGGVALDGTLTSDVAKNTVEVIISNGEIASSSTIDAAAFTFNASNGSFLGGGGKYIGHTGTNNTLNYSDNPLSNTVSIDNNKNAVIDAGSSYVLRFNKTSGQERFRFYRGSQELIQLYKKQTTPTHTLTLNATNGSITAMNGETVIESGNNVAEGAELDITATADDWYKFSGWSVTGTGSSVESTTTNPTTFTMGTADATLTATFAACVVTVSSNDENWGIALYDDESHTISTAAEDGYRISSTEPYTIAPADAATLTAGDDDTFVVSGVKDQDVEITINFEALPSVAYTVTFNAGTNGTCSTTESTESSAGVGVTLPNCTPNAGYQFVGWATTNTATEADAGVAGATYYPTANITLYAVYNSVYTITWSVNGAPTTEGNPTTSVVEGEGITTLPTAPASISGMAFQGWTATQIATSSATAPTDLFTDAEHAPAITANTTFYAVFAEESEGDVTWVKKSVSEISEGGVYAIITTDGHAFNGNISSGHGQVTTTAFSFTNNVAASAPSGTCEITFEAVTGGFKMYNADKGYLYASAASSGKLAWHNTEDSYWYYNSSDNGNWMYKSNSARLRSYNNASIRTYNANNGDVLAFAKKTQDITYTYYTNVVVKQLISISLSGEYPTEFWKGEAFSHEGMIVTAHYNDESTKDVTSSATFTGYNMATAGEQTVTVTYDTESTTYGITVKTIANTQETAYTVAEAKELIDAGHDLATEVYVAGKICQIDSYSSQYNSITYWISTDGTQENMFEVYSGKNLNNTNFTSISDIVLQADVIIYGKIKKFNSTYEFDKNNYLVSYEGPTLYNIYIAEDIATDVTTDPANQAAAGTEVTVTATCTEHFHVTRIKVYDKDEILIPVNDGKFTMPESYVTIYVEIEEDDKYTVTYLCNSYIDTWEEIYEGPIGELREPSELNFPEGFTFAGWSTSMASTTAITESYNVTETTYLYAIFARVEGGSGEATATLTNSDITGSSLEQSYGDFSITNTYGTWSGNACKGGNYQSDGMYFLQLRNHTTTSYLKLPVFPGNITSIVCEQVCNTSKEQYTGYIYFRTKANNDAEYIVSATSNEALDDVTLDIPSGYTTGYIMVSNPCRIYSFTVTYQSGVTKYYTRVYSDSPTIESTTEITDPSVIPSGATLTVYGLTNQNADNLIIDDGGQLVMYNSETDGPVLATVRKNITGYDENTQTRDGYYLIANPTDNTTVANLINPEGYDLYTFNPAGDGAGNEWINMKSSQAVANGTGYLYANSSDVTLEFAGELTPASETEVTLVKATAGTGIDFPGFNLIGNPFACNAYPTDENGIFMPYYKMNEDRNELELVENIEAVTPCEGFFVEAEEDGQTVVITTEESEVESSALSLTVSQNRGSVIDRAIVSFNGRSNLHKFMLNPAHTNISLAKGGENFAAVSTEAEGEMPVNFKAEKNGTYTISVNTENVDAEYLHLIDNMTGADTDLLSTPSYTFDAKTSDYASRFKLVFGVKNDNEEMSQASSFAYINNGEIIISNEGRATLQVIDVMGRIISSEEINGEARISTNGLTAGLYILNLNGMTQKIVVR